MGRGSSCFFLNEAMMKRVSDAYPAVRPAAGRALAGFLIGAACIAAAGTARGATQEDEYPTQPVRLIVPYTAGGGVDKVARVVGDKLAQALGQPVIIDNRGGASGNIGTSVAVNAAPNGYTIVMGAAALAINVSLYNKLPFDTVKDLTPVILLTKTPNILVVHPKVPARSVKELIALAKSRPGVLNYASAGSGTTPHMAAELFRSMAGVDIVHVPYKGSGPAVNAMLAGEVDLMLSPALTVLPHVKSGRLIALGMSGDRRSEAFPEIPTIAESGLPGYEAAQWYGVLAPAGTPPAIVARLNKELDRIIHLPDVKASLESEGSEPVGGSPDAFGAYIKAEIHRWASVIRPQDRLN